MKGQGLRQDGGTNGFWLAALLFVAVATVGNMGMPGQVSPGSRCLVSRAIYGTRDLGKAHDELEKAQNVNDEYGLTELAQRDLAIPISEGTHGLVVDSDFFKHLVAYRQVRILDGPYTGKALWISSDALRVDPGPQSVAAMPENCYDPHESLGANGVCFCELGYKRDAATLECVR
jgi:hypothetical protein